MVGGVRANDEEFNDLNDDEEFKAVMESGDVCLQTDEGERRKTESYYTPGAILEYVVKNTTDPLLGKIRAGLAQLKPVMETSATHTRSPPRSRSPHH